MIEEENGNSGRASLAFNEVTVRVDEAGKVVYKLGNYISSAFGEIFDVVDQDLPRYGIQEYRIKNMTLEQVFIAIGDEEIKKDQKAHGTEEGDEQNLIDELPELVQPSSFGQLKAHLISNFHSDWNGGILFILVALFLILCITYLGIYLPTIVRPEARLNYDKVGKLFSEDMTINYN